MTNPINFQIINGTGIITLNKPKSLNALDLKMVEILIQKLDHWKNDCKIKRVLLKGEGKAFCAGGDVKSMFFSSGISDLKKKFLFKEYRLNYDINNFSKPFLSIWNGIVMGGGVGLSIYGNARVVTENSKFAMPESAIGFFPDVGASYFLSRIRSNVGLYLGLTGAIIKAKEILDLGLATHFYNSVNIKKMEIKYINEGLFIPTNNIKQKESEILNNIKLIDDTFRGNIHSIMKSLSNSQLEFAKKTYESLIDRCPMSLAVTTELYNRAKTLSLKECLEMEFQLSQKIVYREDFNNGVEAVLVSKTHKPKWHPKTINQISNEEIHELFKIHTEKLGL